MFKPASHRCGGVEMGKEVPYVLRVACIKGQREFCFSPRGPRGQAKELERIWVRMTGRSLSSCSIVCVGIGELFTANTHTEIRRKGCIEQHWSAKAGRLKVNERKFKLKKTHTHQHVRFFESERSRYKKKTAPSSNTPSTFPTFTSFPLPVFSQTTTVEKNPFQTVRA